MTTFDEWISALQSGEYKKGKAALRINDEYCCLGVLADLDDKNNWYSSGEVTDDQGTYYGVKYSHAQGTTFYYGEYGSELYAFLHDRIQTVPENIGDVAHVAAELNDNEDNWDPVIHLLKREYDLWLIHQQSSIIRRDTLLSPKEEEALAYPLFGYPMTETTEGPTQKIMTTPGD